MTTPDEERNQHDPWPRSRLDTALELAALACLTGGLLWMIWHLPYLH